MSYLYIAQLYIIIKYVKFIQILRKRLSLQAKFKHETNAGIYFFHWYACEDGRLETQALLSSVALQSSSLVNSDLRLQLSKDLDRNDQFLMFTTDWNINVNGSKLLYSFCLPPPCRFLLLLYRVAFYTLSHPSYSFKPAGSKSHNCEWAF